MKSDDVSEADIALLYILSWLAVRSDDATAIARSLGIADACSCPVEQGLQESGPRVRSSRPQSAWSRWFGPRPPEKELDKCFIARPIDGWTLVFGAELAFNKELRAELSRAFGEAQAFYSDGKHDGFLWARSLAGTTVRAVSVADGEVECEGEGPASEPDDLKRANEYDVLRIARAWSVDPNLIVRAGAPGQIGTRRTSA